MAGDRLARALGAEAFVAFGLDVGSRFGQAEYLGQGLSQSGIMLGQARLLGHDGDVERLSRELAERIRDGSISIDDPALRAHIRQSLADALAYSTVTGNITLALGARENEPDAHVAQWGAAGELGARAPYLAWIPGDNLVGYGCVHNL